MYRHGDKVKIKTWDQMVEEYGSPEDYGSPFDSIACVHGFYGRMEEELNRISINRVLTIKRRKEDGWYHMKEIGWNWKEDFIECLAEKYVEPIPVRNRFELMDLDYFSAKKYFIAGI